MIITVDQWPRLVAVLRAEYGKSDFPDLGSGNHSFIRYFEKENNIKILGTKAGVSWVTNAIEFKDEKDLLFFKLKYGV